MWEGLTRIQGKQGWVCHLWSLYFEFFSESLIHVVLDKTVSNIRLKTSLISSFSTNFSSLQTIFLLTKVENEKGNKMTSTNFFSHQIFIVFITLFILFHFQSSLC
jgi:hypothetical protein